MSWPDLGAPTINQTRVAFDRGYGLELYTLPPGWVTISQNQFGARYVVYNDERSTGQRIVASFDIVSHVRIMVPAMVRSAICHS